MDFHGCTMRHPGQTGIGAVIKDHNEIVVRDFSKPTGETLVIKAEILAFLEGLLQARALSLSNLQVVGTLSCCYLGWLS